MADIDGSSEQGPEAGKVRHIPVLLPEVLEALALGEASDTDDNNELRVFVDGTFGAGGYTRAILEACKGRVVAFDRDPAARRIAEGLLQQYPGRLIFRALPFSKMADVIGQHVDGVVLDIGVSSMQLDDSARGFSFQADGPLDMRMSAAGGEATEDRPTAADLVNSLPEAKLADLIFQFGEERRSRAIARAICRRRETEPFTSTLDLANVAASTIGRSPRNGPHPATRTFQALRIAVNDELGELARGLYAAEALLRPGGRLVVVTFHSLEDRIVKRFLQLRSGRKAGSSRHLPETKQFDQPSFQIINQRPLAPGNQELARNPRARSAKLRWAVRAEGDAGPADYEALGLPPWRPE